jgi:hypothetical protein
MRHLKWIMLVVVVLSLMLAPAALAAPAPQYGQCGYWYQVRWGNTLSSISRYTGVSTWAIAQANGLANPHYIYAGQWLWIPCPTTPPPPPPPQCGYWYTVQWGDTMNSIAIAPASARGLSPVPMASITQSHLCRSILWIPCPCFEVYR